MGFGHRFKQARYICSLEPSLLTHMKYATCAIFHWLAHCYFVNVLFACGALAASISVGIVIPSIWFVYLYKQTVSITVVVMEQNSSVTRQLTDSKLRQGSYRNGKTEVQDFYRTILGFFTIFQGLNFFPILYNTTF